jgi:hypothetical protein
MISILLPTRRRLAWLTRTVESAHTTARGPIEFCCYIDEDDPTSADKAQELGLKYIVGPRIVLTNCWNKCIPLASGDTFMQGNDDIIFRTPGWDCMVQAFFDSSTDKLWFVHGHGVEGHIKFGTHGFIHRNWVDIVGYFTPPFFSSDYGDTWLNDVANALGRRQYLPFFVEHMHFLWEKAPLDRTSEERLQRHDRDNTPRLYQETADLRDEDVRKLRRKLQ